jgi:hypothetical protein
MGCREFSGGYISSLSEMSAGNETMNESSAATIQRKGAEIFS